MPSAPPGRPFCSVVSRKLREPLVGTASRVDLWLLLEVPGAWPDEVTDALQPDTPQGRALLPVLKAVPRSRVLFIKGEGRKTEDQFSFYVAVSDEAESRLYHFPLASYAALEEIDLFSVLAGDEAYEAQRDLQPLYLVCTHGTHDRCCAKFGFPLYCGLAQAQPGRVWQCSHVGGDRFAANLIALPHGLYYGHVEAEDAETILERTAQGRLYRRRLRGRTCYGSAVQAAEQYLRQSQNETRIPAYRLSAHRRTGAVSEVAFAALEAGKLHTVWVEAVPQPESRFLTCGSGKAGSITGYRLLEYRIRPLTPQTIPAGGAEYALHPAAMRDYGFIYRLRRETMRPYLDEINMRSEERGPFLARFDVTRHQIVSLDGDPVGAMSVVQRGDGLRLANLHLLPAHQGRGLGTALVQHIQSEARAEGQRLTTQVLKVNPARAFYERLGFRVDGEEGLRYCLVWEP